MALDLSFWSRTHRIAMPGMARHWVLWPPARAVSLATPQPLSVQLIACACNKCLGAIGPSAAHVLAEAARDFLDPVPFTPERVRCPFVDDALRPPTVSSRCVAHRQNKRVVH